MLSLVQENPGLSPRILQSDAFSFTATQLATNIKSLKIRHFSGADVLWLLGVEIRYSLVQDA